MKKVKKRNFLGLTLSLLVLLACPVEVRAEETDSADEESTLAPYFFIEGADPETDHPISS